MNRRIEHMSRWIVVGLIVGLVIGGLVALSSAAERHPVPRYDDSIEADEVWFMHDGCVVRKERVTRLTDTCDRPLTVYGPRGSRITFCPPGGCPPDQPGEPPVPPDFDFPGDEPELDEPELTVPDDGLLTPGTHPLAIVLYAAAAVGGTVSAVAARKHKLEEQPPLPTEEETVAAELSSIVK